MCNCVMWHPNLFALKSFLYKRSVSKLVFFSTFEVSIYTVKRKKYSGSKVYRRILSNYSKSIKKCHYLNLVLSIN